MAYQNIASAMNGSSPAFSLPPGYGYNELADYEEQRRKAFSTDLKNQLAGRRAQLSTALTQQGTQLFNSANPGILEDLNSRGLLSSSTAVNQEQARALKEIELSNQGYLNDFDTAATAAGIQSDQDALDSALDLRRGQLEQQNMNAQADREEALARDLAKQQGRNSLTSSLIGAGGSLGSAYLGAKALGGLGAKTAATTAATGGLGATGVSGATGTGGLSGSLSLFSPGGFGSAATAPSTFAQLGGFGGLAAIGGAGLASALISRAADKKLTPLLGKTAGSLGSVIANPIGAQLNFAKKLATDPKKAVSSVGKSVSKAAKKVFCFDAQTPITMEDGSQVPICQLHIGAETKGGVVESIRTSKTDEGTRYLYKGIRVTGKHAVKENGKWLRVEDSAHSDVLRGGGIVWSIVTDKHRIYVNGIELADEHETDQYEDLSIDQSLEVLNRQEEEAVA